MKILIAPNAFKGSLTAIEAAEAMALGVLRAAPDARVDLMPISDGGDGLLDALLARGGRKVFTPVTGPLGGRLWAPFALLPGRVAAVEMAQASGLALLAPGRRDIWKATSFGTGELLAKALEHGVRTLLVGLGGSASNDAGAGMAQALGVALLDDRGRPIGRGAAGLKSLARIESKGLDRRLRGVRVLALSDVRNPLLGAQGSARVYGPQKGAKPKDIPILEAALSRFSAVVRRDLGVDVAARPGAGAAGGMGAGLLAFLKARFEPGGAWVLDHVDAKRRIGRADVVLTGEGRLDEQSLYGKAPVALAELAKRQGRSVIAVCGSWDSRAAARFKRRGISQVIALMDSVSRARAHSQAPRLLAEAAQRVVEGLRP